MELLLCLFLVILLRVIVTSAAPPPESGEGALAPCDMPLRVHQLVRRTAQGISIRTVHVEMDGASAVRYRVAGSVPDGGEMVLVVHGNGEVTGTGCADGCGELPQEVRQRLFEWMPSFHPTSGAVRRVCGRKSVWYEIDGELSDGLLVDVKISHDGHDLLMTVSGRRP